MRKTSSTGRVSEYNPRLQKMKQRFTYNISKNYENPKQLKLLQISNYPIEPISNTKTIKTTKTINRNISLNQNQNQNELYDELMYLKRRVNNLNAQISFAKSQKRKKDMQINSKKKELANYMSDIHMSKDISPVGVGKLKDSNMISLIKKEYYNVKKLLNDKIKEEKNLENYLKKAKPNVEIKKNEELENQLRILLNKYNEIQKKNNEDSKIIQLKRNLAQVFQMNHTKIEEMKNLLYQTENNINRLKNIADDMNNENSKNNEILRKQNISKANVNKHIEHLMNEKKNKEEIVKMRAIYEKKIKTLEDELKDLKSKCSRNDTDINNIKQELLSIEKFKNNDLFKLRQFNYKNLKKIDKDPLENVNSKIILLKSLIDESNNNIKRYKENILGFNEQLKEMGYEPFDVNDLLNYENAKNEKTNTDKKSEIKNNDINDEINNEEEKEKNEKEKIEKIKESDGEINIIKNNLESDGNKQRFESTKEEETKNEINLNIKPSMDKTDEIKEQINKNTSENNNEIKISDNNDEEEQKITEHNNNVIISSSNNNNIIQEENLNINTNNIDTNNDVNINTNENNNTNNINNQKLLTEEEFSEFTFVLVKNLEAKKITAEIAKEKIILIQNKNEEIPNEKFIQQMSHNILTCLNNKNEESIQKLNRWLNFILNISENNQNMMSEKFLSLLTNIKIYTPEEELLLSKKVKKYLLPKKDIILSKLEPFKNKFISFLFLKQIIEEQKVEMKDDYSQYLFYAMKKFDEPTVSLYDLKVQNIFDILNDDQHDSKMDEESDIEITSEEFTTIISNFIMQLMMYLNKNKTTLREVLKDLIQSLNVDEEDLNQEKIEIVLIEPFINRMKEIGIAINNDIETFCIFNRYKLTDEYEIISVNLLEREIENFEQMNVNRNLAISTDNKDKVMEKVQEETEDNISNIEK
jgi:hypothetical protein